ncbi:MAG: hypothetical protein WCI73_02920 [Phycisphaerae bacterium]
MTTPRKTILIFLPMLVLVGVSLYHQFTRPAPIGAHLHQLLSAADSHPLDPALPLMVDQSTPSAGVRWQLLPAAAADTETYVAPGPWRLVRHRNQPWPERSQITDPRVAAPLLRALANLGYVNHRPRELLDGARRNLEELSDAGLLMALIQADADVLDRRTELDAALRDALLLRVRDFAGAAVTIPLSAGRLFVLEPDKSGLSSSENVAYLRYVDAAGRGKWHGTLAWPLRPGPDSRGVIPTPGGMLQAFLAQHEQTQFESE